MKKALAVVLAVMMLGTLAFAVPVLYDGGATAIGGGTTEYNQVKPGAKLHFLLDDLTLHALTKYIAKDDDGKFLPDKNKVTVTFGKGGELVEKQGWVRIGEFPTDNPANELYCWQYQIVLKDSNDAVCDGKSLDFSILNLKFKAEGQKEVNYVFDGKSGNPGKIERDYGFKTGELLLKPSTDAQGITGLSAEFPDQDIIYTMTANVDSKGKAVNENTWVMQYPGATEHCSDVTFRLKAGDKIIRKDIASLNAAKLSSNNGYDPTKVQKENGNDIGAVNDTNLVGVATVPMWQPTWNAYAVAADGETVSRIAVQVEDGVATLKVPSFSEVFAYDGVLKNVRSTIGAEAPADPKNPPTGANDVVGVAAALAVVALVSGAAISLKK